MTYEDMNGNGPQNGGEQQYGVPRATDPNGAGPQFGDPNGGGTQFTGPNIPGGQPGGDWWHMNPFKLVESWLPEQAKRTIRVVYGVVGLAAVVLGLALLFWPGKTLVVFTVALGIYFLISGAIRIVGAIVEMGLPGGWRVLDILVGVLLVVGGIVMLKNTQLSATVLTVLVTMTVGIGWIVEGIMALAESWRIPSSGWAIVYAVISLIAGVVVLFSPITSMVWLIVFSGCIMVVLGVLSVVRAFRFGRN